MADRIMLEGLRTFISGGCYELEDERLNKIIDIAKSVLKDRKAIIRHLLCNDKEHNHNQHFVTDEPHAKCDYKIGENIPAGNLTTDIEKVTCKRCKNITSSSKFLKVHYAIDDWNIKCNLIGPYHLSKTVILEDVTCKLCQKSLIKSDPKLKQIFDE